MRFKLPTFNQVMGGGRSAKPPERGHIAAAQGRALLQQSIAYRTYLKQIENQRRTSSQQADAAAQKANQAATLANQQAKAVPPVARPVSYGGNRYSRTLAERPAVDIPYPKYPKFPSAPKYGAEPVGSLEKGMPNYFYSMSENNRHDTDKTYYNAWKSETAAKQKWRDQIAKIDKNYESQMGRFNKGLASFNKGVTAFQNEIKARAEAASRPVIPLVESGEAAKPAESSGRLRRGTGRGTLLAGNTGGFNPATGGGRLGGMQRSLLG